MLGKARGDERCRCARERGSLAGSFVLSVFIWRPGRRICVEYSSAFQMCHLGVLVSTDWLAPGQGIIVIAGGSDISLSVPLPACAAFLGQELKCN